jgi:hypothetical protein
MRHFDSIGIPVMKSRIYDIHVIFIYHYDSPKGFTKSVVGNWHNNDCRIQRVRNPIFVFYVRGIMDHPELSKPNDRIIDKT